MPKYFYLFFILIFIFPSTSYAWWNQDYSHRFKYTITNTNVSENLTAYPLLIDLTNNIPDEFWSNVLPNYNDLRIIDQDDATDLTPSSHLEFWDNNTNSAYLWTKKTILTTGTPNYVWIYYGNGGASNAFSETTKQNTYSSNFAANYHFEESSGTFYDETANNYDSLSYNLSRADGLIYKGLSLDGEGDYITLPDIVDESSPPFAYSFWINPNNVTDSEQVIYSNGSSNPVLKLEEDDLVFAYNSTANGSVDCRAQDIISASTWQHLGVNVYPNGTLNIYLNGVQQSLTGYCTIDPISDTGSGSISINSSSAFNGLLDEFRFFNNIVSPDWFKFTYLNDRLLSGNYGQEQPFYVQDLNESLTSVLSSNWTSDLSSTILEGVYSVGLKNATYRIASFAVDFTDSFIWSSLLAGSDGDNYKSFFHYPGGYSSLPGASGTSFTLYIPRGDTYKVRVCPNADSLVSVTQNCDGQYYLEEDDNNLESVIEDGTLYWKVSGLTGSGGEGVYPSLTFTLGGVGASTLTNGVTTNVATQADKIDFSTVMPGSPYFAAQELIVTTNAIDGYTVQAKMGSFLQGYYPANQITEFSYNGASWADPQIWTSPTGTIPNVNTGWIGANTSDTRVPNWSSEAGKFGPLNTSNRTIMYSSQSDETGTSAYLTLALEINENQPQDKYMGSIIYTLTSIY